jgi:hypothetical protein
MVKFQLDWSGERGEREGKGGKGQGQEWVPRNIIQLYQNKERKKKLKSGSDDAMRRFFFFDTRRLRKKSVGRSNY